VKRRENRERGSSSFESGESTTARQSERSDGGLTVIAAPRAPKPLPRALGAVMGIELAHKKSYIRFVTQGRKEKFGLRLKTGLEHYAREH
jgi:hypothetical protein